MIASVHVNKIVCRGRQLNGSVNSFVIYTLISVVLCMKASNSSFIIFKGVHVSEYAASKMVFAELA